MTENISPVSLLTLEEYINKINKSNDISSEIEGTKNICKINISRSNTKQEILNKLIEKYEDIKFNKRKDIIKETNVYNYLKLIYGNSLNFIENITKETYPIKYFDENSEPIDIPNTNVKFWRFNNNPEYDDIIISLINTYKKYEPKKPELFVTYEKQHDEDYYIKGKRYKINYDVSSGKKFFNYGNFTNMFINRKSNIIDKLKNIKNIENYLKKKEKIPFYFKTLEKTLQKKIEEEKELETKYIRKLLNKRTNNLKQCGNSLKNNESYKVMSNFFIKQSENEKLVKNNNLETIFNEILFSNKNLKLDQHTIDSMTCPEGWNDHTFIIFKNILKLQTSKVFLLGSFRTDLKKFLSYKQIFYLFPAYSVNKNIENKINKEIIDSCFWTPVLNYFFLYLIMNSKTDFSSFIMIPPEHKFTKKRAKINPQSLKDVDYTFIGFLLIPHIGNKSHINPKARTHEIFICVFYNKDRRKKIILTSLDLIEINIGEIIADYTILYDEIKGLFTYLNKLKLKNINAYYNDDIKDVLFLSTKKEEYIINKYNLVNKSCGFFKKVNYEFNNDFKNVKFIDNSNKTIFKSTSNRSEQLNFELKLELEQPAPHPNISGGSNDININKIIFVPIILLHNFYLYLYNKYKKKIMKKYNINYNVIFRFLYIYYSEMKLIVHTKNFFVNTYFTLGWKNSLQLLYPDLKNFNKNIKICEISVLPSAFEILKNFNVDVFYTNYSYIYENVPIWIERINKYKNKTTKNINFIYNKTKYLIHKKYDIIIIDLIKNLKEEYKKNNYEMDTIYLEYSIKTVLKYVKNQIKYLDYIKIGGSCYFKIHNLWTKNIINIYYHICTLFENVNPFYINYEDIFKQRHGGCWLKCFNKLKNPKKIDKEILFRRLEEFNYNIYNTIIQKYYSVDRFINEKLYNDNEQLKISIFNMQLNTAINFSKDYNLKISPEWKKIIKNKTYINLGIRDVRGDK